MLAVCSCAQQPNLIIILKSDGVPKPPDVKLHLQTIDQDEPTETGPFPTSALPENQFAEIPPGTPFSIDVFGCTSEVKEDCDEDVELTARGCTDSFITLTKDEGQKVEIVLHKSTEAPNCPTPKP